VADDGRGSHEEREDDMTKGREESDGLHGTGKPPKGGLNPDTQGGGKAATASQQARQLELFSESADSPQGAVAGADTGRPVPAPRAVPLSGSMKGTALPPMTMEEVADLGTLRWAFEKVKANDGAPGPDRQSIREVDEQLDEILPELSRSLLDGSYRPGLIRRVWIPKAGGGQRGLGIPDVVDRIVQQAVHLVMSPHYDPTFHASSHGFRPGRSCHTAIAEARRYLEEGDDWVVDLDLEKFFDRVHHDRLVSRLEERVTDRRLLRLIRRMLKAKVVMPDGVVVTTDEGTPQGGPLSPLLSNIVLDELDQEMTRRGYRFVRYADDTNIYVRSQRSGQRVMASIIRFIERRLRLKVNADKSAVAKPEERHFLGFRLRREPTDGSTEVLLSKRSLDRIEETIKAKTPRTWGQSVESCIEALNSYTQGWIGFFWICTAAEERTLCHLDERTRRRLRAIILRHWKHRRTMVRRLVKLGVSLEAARRSVLKRHRSWWTLSHTPAVERGLSNQYFLEHGLESLQARWKEKHAQVVVIGPIQLRLALG
jgi:group II intron reverse transcriptase/maturase